MALPTVSDIRDYLEGYCIDSTTLSDTWILNRMNNFIIPTMENFLSRPLEGTTEVSAYLSGKGRKTLILPHKDITELVSIEYVVGSDYNAGISLSSVELIADEGILRSKSNLSEGLLNITFAKGERNIKVTYKVGSTTIPPDLKEAVIYLTCEKLLGFLGARTGGGSLTVQGFSRNYGERGKYQDIRNDLSRQAMAIMSKYITGVTGDGN